MFENLIESQPKRQRSWRQTTASILLHVAMIFIAVKATQGAAEAVQDIVQQDASFLLPPPPPPPPPPEAPPPDAVVVENPPPLGFQTMTPPKNIPTEIPPIDLNEKFDASNFSGVGREGGIATGVIGGTGPVPEIVTTQTYTSDEVDSPVLRTGGPDLVYPPGLADFGIAGTVRLRYIVGTNGRVESNSIQVISSTNKAFEPAAIKLVRGSTYRPAMMRGQAVRQLVEQSFSFKVPT